MINQFLFYVILQLDALTAVTATVCILSGIGFAIVLTCGVVFKDDITDRKSFERIRRLLFLVLCISAVILILVPTTDSAIALFVNKNINADNIDKVVSSFKDCVDYIVNAISTVK